MRVALLVGLILVSVGSVADAKFADSEGFSGRHGMTCGACHTTPPAQPHPPIRLHLDGMPEAWDVDASYDLAIRVEGGPTSPPGQPQAGFDLEVDAGRLGPGPGMDGLLRFPSDEEATYTGAGTRQREWHVTWNAPEAVSPPGPAHFWLAGLAANGNHLADGMATLGELGDVHTRLERSVPPSDAAVDAFRNRPIPAPVLDAPPDSVREGGTVVVQGRAPEFADGVEWRLDGGDASKAKGLPAFLILIEDPSVGPHVLDVRASWLDLRSAPALHNFTVTADGPLAVPPTEPAGPSPVALALGAGLVLALLLPFVKKLRT